MKRISDKFLFATVENHDECEQNNQDLQFQIKLFYFTLFKKEKSIFDKIQVITHENFGQNLLNFFLNL